ncbi:hypothetical protein PCASD_19931 [Puccinia coronata f. sp. avenae]|uniref:Uncharacterized protein n=1 Tax=Puccinia coronata f. sp. avenae TaxID=200324 RepID=A0A2N5U7P9_9BASI|nr:hypothetical protein PCASD_19931 [Puccinia coronata f. sp. avenae]
MPLKLHLHFSAHLKYLFCPLAPVAPAPPADFALSRLTQDAHPPSFVTSSPRCSSSPPEACQPKPSPSPPLAQSHLPLLPSQGIATAPQPLLLLPLSPSQTQT